jgi:thiol-disulfide isomerase/thioredoxin
MTTEPVTSTLQKWSFWITPICLFAGLVLSVISALHLCTAECAAAHEYRLWGMKFETVGIPFFIAMNIGYWIARKYATLMPLVMLLLMGGVGAEAMFIYAQKFIIGHWCPVCLGIAACITIAALGTLILTFKPSSQDFNMNKYVTGSLAAFALLTGFTSSFFGFSKFDQLAAAEADLRTTLAFGDQNSKVELYLFTDWLCPACRQIEPAIEAMFPKITAKARFYFVDVEIHPETLNFIPFNLAFMTHNKKDYFKLRDALTKLSLTTKTPNDHQVEELAKKLGVNFQELNYADVNTGIKYFKHLSKQFSIEKTPTLVVINRDAKKGKKLQGEKEITEQNVLKTIQLMSGA